MRAAIVEAMGRPPAPAEVPEPRRRPGEALVRIRAAALSPVELHTEELALDGIGDAWERLSRSAGRRLVVKP